MAVTKYSTPFQVKGPQEVIDLEMLDSTLAFKQEKYDAGFLKVSTTLDSYSALELERESDKEYLNNKLNLLTEEINQQSNADLSDVKVVYQLEQQAKSLMKDKTLMTKLKSTQDHKKYEEHLDKLKTDPKLRSNYSEINEWYDRKNYISPWLKGETDVIGIHSPTLKVDTDKILTTAMKELKAVESTTHRGMYEVNNKLVTKDALLQIGYTMAGSNLDVQAQLVRNAAYLNRDKTPDDIKRQAVQDMQSSIVDTKNVVERLTLELSNPNVSSDRKSEIRLLIGRLNGSADDNKSIAAMEARKLALSNKQVTEQEAQGLAYQSYLRTYMEGVALPYVQDITKENADPVAMFQQKQTDDREKQENMMNFTREQNRLKMEQKEREMAQDFAIASQRINGTGKKGTPKPGYESGILDSTIPLPAMQDNEFDVIGAYQGRVSNLNDQIYETIFDVIKEDLISTNPELYNKLEPLLKAGTNFSKLPKSVKLQIESNKGLHRQFAQYRQWLKAATDPNDSTVLFKSDELRTKHAQAHNIVTDKIIERAALQRSLKEARENIWRQAKKENPDLSEEEFNKQMVPNTIIDYGEFGTIPRSYTFGNKYYSRVSEELKKDSYYNKFNRLDVIADDDPDFGKGSQGAKIVEEHIRGRVGINGMDGIKYGVDGMMGKKEATKSIDNLQSVRIIGFEDYGNRVHVEYMYGEEGKVKGRGTVELDAQTMHAMGRKAASDEGIPFTQRIYEGGHKMEDSNGNPMYYDLTGHNGMGGNVQYRFWAFEPDEAHLEILVNIGGQEQHVTLKNKKFYGQDVRPEAAAYLTDLYSGIHQNLTVANAKKPKEKRATDEQINRLALNDFYKAIQTR